MFLFLNPLMLFGMAAGSIPLIIHFLTKRKTQRVFFGSLRFLKEMEGSKKSSINIDFLLLLFLRILIISLFCAALARPLLKKKAETVVSKPKETMVTSVEVMRPLRVLLITDSEDSDEENFYIKQAFFPAKDSPVVLKAVSLTKLDYSAFQSFHVIILNNLSRIDKKLQSELLKFANSGRGILVSLGNNVSIKDYNENSSLLPAIPKFKIGNEEETDRSFKVTYFDKSHPMFKIFTDESFASSHFYSFYIVGAVCEPPLQLAGFDDGSPFIVERKIGTGKVLLFTSPIDLSWSNFPVSPNYLPLLHQAVYYLAKPEKSVGATRWVAREEGDSPNRPYIKKEISSIFLLLVLVLLIFEYILSNKKFRANPYKLRIAAILVVLFALLRPSIPITMEKIKKNNLIFLIDNSGSMGVRDENGKDRLSRLKRLFKEGKVFNKDILKKDNLHFYSFSSKLNKIDVKDIQALEVSNSNTDFLGALTEISRSFDVKSISGVFILSDGIDSDPNRTVKLVESMPYPVFTVSPGEERAFKDISIKLQNVPEKIFLDKKTTIKFVVESFKDAFCVLKEDGVELKREKFLVRPGKNLLSLEFISKNIGPHRYSISIPVEDGEASFKNNQDEFYLNVRKEGPYILVLAGAPSLEYKFLHKYLSKEPGIKAMFLVLKNETEFFELGFPKTKEELFRYDIVIFNDIEKWDVLGPLVTWIKEFVGERGGGVLVLGDKNSSPLEDVLPVVFRKEWTLLSKDKFSFELTRDGKGHPVTQLLPDSIKNSQIWKELPDTDGCDIVERSKPGATVLAVRSRDKNVVWAVQSYGKGRAMAIVADGLWQWDFLMVGIGKTSEAYRHFWDRVVSWLTSTKGDVFDDRMDKVFAKKDLTEWQNLRIDEKFLKEISNKGHGKFRQNLKTKVAYNLTLWDNIFVFCLFVALLAYEWYLRRMSGLR